VPRPEGNKVQAEADPPTGRRTPRERGGARHWLIILPPLIFLTLFLLVPFAIAFKISLAESAIAVPPFTPLLSTTADGHTQISVTFANYRLLGTDAVYLLSYIFSLRTAFFATCRPCC